MQGERAVGRRCEEDENGEYEKDDEEKWGEGLLGIFLQPLAVTGYARSRHAEIVNGTDDNCYRGSTTAARQTDRHTHSAGKHVIHECSQAPPVDSLTVAAPCQDLRSPVRTRRQRLNESTGHQGEESDRERYLHVLYRTTECVRY